jgi:hypothetical protein
LRRDGAPLVPPNLIYRQSDWLMVPRPLAFELAKIDTAQPELRRTSRALDARDRRLEGLFLSPIHRDAADHVVEVVTIWCAATRGWGPLDYIRYPGPLFDYSRAALLAFRQDLDPANDACRASAIRSVEHDGRCCRHRHVP